jgi:hypothetical protein
LDSRYSSNRFCDCRLIYKRIKAQYRIKKVKGGVMKKNEKSFIGIVEFNHGCGLCNYYFCLVDFGRLITFEKKSELPRNIVAIFPKDIWRNITYKKKPDPESFKHLKKKKTRKIVFHALSKKRIKEINMEVRKIRKEGM